MSPQVERSEPPYVQVVRALRARIESGQLKDGDMLPSVRKITEEWGISHATATKVLGALRAEGLAEGRPGIGTVVVASSWVRSAHDRVISMQTTGKIYPPNERAQITIAELMEAPAQVANALGITEGAPAIRRVRITYRDDAPVSASTSWFDGGLAEVAPALLVAERLRQGTPGYIAETTGRTVDLCRDQLAADMANEDDAEALGVPIGSAVHRKRNWFLDAEGGVVEYGESVAAAERWTTYEYKITS